MLNAENAELIKKTKAEYFRQYREAHKDELRKYNSEYQKKYRKTEKGKQATREAQQRYWCKKALEAGAITETPTHTRPPKDIGDTGGQGRGIHISG